MKQEAVNRGSSYQSSGNGTEASNKMVAWTRGQVLIRKNLADETV